MGRIEDAQSQYEAETGFASENEEQRFLLARRAFISERVSFHLTNPEFADLDVMSMEHGQLTTFIIEAAADLFPAASTLWNEIEKQAGRLAEKDADYANFDTIMAAL